MCVEEKARRQECAAVSTREAEEALRFSEVAHEATQGLALLWTRWTKLCCEREVRSLILE